LRHPDIEKGFEMAERIAFEVNEETRTVEVAPDTPLLYVLRNELGLRARHEINARFGR
jgi:aerobic-type carbon monoxide dehydrogenase small subunit (CoxS/CutS family)